MSNHEITQLLRDYQQMKRELRDLRLEMQRIVVEELGVARKVAQHTNLETFLDGYLAGNDTGRSGLAAADGHIACLLHRSQEVRKRTRELRVRMVKFAVEDLGMGQSAALQSNLEVFFDGYLVGQGLIQHWRKNEPPHTCFAARHENTGRHNNPDC